MALMIAKWTELPQSGYDWILFCIFSLKPVRFRQLVENLLDFRVLCNNRTLFSLSPQNCQFGIMTEVQRIRPKAAIQMFTSTRWPFTEIRSVWATTGLSSATPTNTTKNLQSLITVIPALKPWPRLPNMNPGSALSKNIRCSITISILSAGQRMASPVLRARTIAV